MTRKEIPDSTGLPPPSLMLAIRKILRPLIRLLLSFRIAFPQLTEMLKGLYVEVADKEFRLPDKAQTDTRLSLLTGIHRKDIKRLRQQNEHDNEVPPTVNIGGKLVNQWITEPAYQDEHGKPANLPMKSTSGPSFEKLVEDVCKQDIRPRVILDEWLNLGVVSLSDEKEVSLNTQAFIPSKGLEEKAFFLGHSVSDHLAAATHNILYIEPPFFDRCVYYDNLSEASIEQLRTLVSEKGMETLVAINELAIKLKSQDTPGLNNNHRLNIGLYVYHETKEKGHE